jgi:hypothetical protein
MLQLRVLEVAGGCGIDGFGVGGRDGKPGVMLSEIRGESL